MPLRREDLENDRRQRWVTKQRRPSGITVIVLTERHKNFCSEGEIRDYNFSQCYSLQLGFTLILTQAKGLSGKGRTSGICHLMGSVHRRHKRNYLVMDLRPKIIYPCWLLFFEDAL